MGCSLPSGFDEFKLRVNIKTTIEKAYKACATPAGLELWFLREALFHDADGTFRSGDEWIQENDIYSMLWYGYPDIVAEKGKVLHANGKNKFRFTFSHGCHVCIHIYEEYDETIVELTESNLPVDEESKLKHYAADLKGWNFYLTNLKSVLEGGLDLRNKRMELVDVITA